MVRSGLLSDQKENLHFLLVGTGYFNAAFSVDIDVIILRKIIQAVVSFIYFQCIVLIRKSNIKKCLMCFILAPCNVQS